MFASSCLLLYPNTRLHGFHNHVIPLMTKSNHPYTYLAYPKLVIDIESIREHSSKVCYSLHHSALDSCQWGKNPSRARTCRQGLLFLNLSEKHSCLVQFVLDSLHSCNFIAQLEKPCCIASDLRSNKDVVISTTSNQGKQFSRSSVNTYDPVHENRHGTLRKIISQLHRFLSVLKANQCSNIKRTNVIWLHD